MGDAAQNDELKMLKHDIKNQLSNIMIAVEQLRYELPNANNDCAFYMDAISSSCEKINLILKKE